jgi:hypothetical protein
MGADRYGIPIPADGAALMPDIVLLPLLAFDAQGFRLGYGGGYFDRTLAAMVPRPQAIGVGFELGRVADIRPQAHDARLDAIVTEAGVFAPGLAADRAGQTLQGLVEQRAARAEIQADEARRAEVGAVGQAQPMLLEVKRRVGDAPVGGELARIDPGQASRLHRTHVEAGQSGHGALDGARIAAQVVDQGRMPVVAAAQRGLGRRHAEGIDVRHDALHGVAEVPPQAVGSGMIAKAQPSPGML